MKAETLQDILTAPGLMNFGLDAQELLKESYLLDVLPSAVYVCDLTGMIRRYNRKAVELWGREPKTGDKDERFCGAFRLYLPDGTYLPHDQTPVVACLTDGMPRTNLEVVIERPDLSRITVNVNIVPIRNSSGILIGMLNCFHDITEQKKNERELSRKRYELQDYVDNATIGLHWVDSNGIILWANKAELDMLGYRKDEYVGQHISDFHVYRDKIDNILQRLDNNEALHNYESVLRCKDGSTKTVSINSNVYREGGKFVHTRCFTVDITEQKKHLKALEEVESTRRQLLESLPVSLYTCDSEGRITYFNSQSVKLWGRAPEIGVDRWTGSWRIYTSEGSPVALDSCPMAIALKGGKPVRGVEIVVERPDGSRRSTLPHPTPLFDQSGKITGAVNVIVDLTELRQAEAALEESEDRFRKAADSAPILFWMADANGRRIFTNKTWKKFTNHGDHHDEGWKTVIHPEDLQNYQRIYAQAFKEPNPFSIEYRLKREDGAYRWVLEQGTPRYSQDGAFEGFFGSCIDIEDKKNRTEALEKEVEKRTKELKFANLRLQRYNEQLEQFAYAASHDMKEPLRKISFYNGHVYDSLNHTLPQKQKEYLERSIAATERMQKLIEDLLTYSTTATNTHNLEIVDLNICLEEVLEAHRVSIEETKATIKSGRLPQLKAIPFQMDQLFDNIIGNALKYRHADRPPKITITHELVKGSSTALAELDEQSTYHRITFTDNGIGFEIGYAPKIFDLFQRLHGRSEFPGSGIGLAICKKIVQNHLGHIEANGTPGQGASFIIYLPD